MLKALQFRIKLVVSLLELPHPLPDFLALRSLIRAGCRQLSEQPQQLLKFLREVLQVDRQLIRLLVPIHIGLEVGGERLELHFLGVEHDSD